MQKYKKGMENIGDWLYLVIIAVAVFSSLIKPKKKQNLNTPPPVANNQDLEPWETEEETAKKSSSPQQQVPSWQEILKSLTEERPVVKKEKPKTEPKPFIQSHLSAENTKNKKKPVQSSISDRIKKFSGDAFYEEESSSINLDFSNLDEIKKGIIYSEIFNKRF